MIQSIEANTVSVRGQVKMPGTYRVEAGENLLDIIFSKARGMAHKRFGLKAVLIGGSCGFFAREDALKAELTQSAEIIVFDEGSCMVNVVKILLDYNRLCLTDYEGCTACKGGLTEACLLLAKLISGQGSQQDLSALTDIAAAVNKGCSGNCSVLQPLASALELWDSEFQEHAAGRCGASICADLMLSPCSNSCPAGVDLPGTIALMQTGKYTDALALGREANPFFITCGYVCEDPPCQNNCKRLAFDDAVYSQSLHRYAADKASKQAGSLAKALKRPTVAVRTSTNFKIAIAGAGPAGLSAAYSLARLGHKVVIYEKSSVAGGMPARGIPQYRLPREALQAEIEAIRSLGVEIVTGKGVGHEITLPELQANYDAVLLALGAGKSRWLRIPGEELPGVLGALDFLEEAALTGQAAVGRQVLVVGGGNVAVDAARTAKRLGAAEVTMMCVEDRFEMPASAGEIRAAEAEGINIKVLAVPLVFNGGEKVAAAVYATVKPGPYDVKGRRWPPVPIEAERKEMHVDTVIVAIGQAPDLAWTDGLGLEKSGPYIKCDHRGATSLEKVFAAGDCTGPVNTVVKAVRSGKNAAASIHAYLTGAAPAEFKSLRSELRSFAGMYSCSKSPRVVMPELEPSERIRTFSVVELGLNDELACYEMARCICAAKGDI